MTQFRPTTALLSLALLASASGASLYWAARLAPKPEAPAPSPAPPVPRRRPMLVLEASWYGEPHHGRRTASGETFDQWALTAAHRTLPFGTRLRLRCRTGGPAVVVRVNDRGPYARDHKRRFTRDLDLSRAAAERLGFLQHGLALVQVEVLPERSSHGRP